MDTKDYREVYITRITKENLGLLKYIKELEAKLKEEKEFNSQMRAEISGMPYDGH